ncbi:MAG: Na/Pi cotransporter family protein [Ruminococcaceae bacterium]|nr:Na/Pi cotransporter family protein [Oscillospiraceae bacterium]
MTVFDVLNLIGGLCLFLFGMNVMGDGLERRAGNSLKALLGKLTNNPIKGFLTGLGVTAVIQSSSATTVMVVGFVNSKIMTLKQSIGIIMGANIGTTVTAWILSLGGISGDNIVMKLLKPTSFTPILALIGIIFMMFAKSGKKKDVGTILLGFATLMFGMNAMSSAVSGLSDIPAFQNLFIMFKNPILGVLVGAILTSVIQSSSASVGILQALSATGAVSYGAAIPIIMGQNIGTCVTALLSSLGTNKNARRASIVHLLFNVIGTVVWLTVFSIISIILRPAVLDASASYFGIAVSHSIFNVLCTALLLPMSSLLEKLAYILVPEGKEAEKIVELDERLLATPTIALQQCYNVAKKMANEAVAGFKLAISTTHEYDAKKSEKIRAMEGNTDHYEDILGTYLTKLSRSQITEEDSSEVSKLLKAIGDFERISDHSVNILESVEELKEKKIEFSEDAKKELDVLLDAVSEILDITLCAFNKDDENAVYNVEPLEQVIDGLKSMLRDRHIVRLTDGECTVEAGFIWGDLLTNLERTSDHCSNIATCLIDATHHNMNAHEYKQSLINNNPVFDEKFRLYGEKYKLSC